MNQLRSLESLILNYNKICVLPDSICELKELKMLWLSGNNITRLPQHFGKLTKLAWSWWCSSSALDGNPLQHPPLHVAKQGPQAIEQYFRRQHGEKTTLIKRKT